MDFLKWKISIIILGELCLHKQSVCYALAGPWIDIFRLKLTSKFRMKRATSTAHLLKVAHVRKFKTFSICLQSENDWSTAVTHVFVRLIQWMAHTNTHSKLSTLLTKFDTAKAINIENVFNDKFSSIRSFFLHFQKATELSKCWPIVLRQHNRHKWNIQCTFRKKKIMNYLLSNNVRINKSGRK